MALDSTQLRTFATVVAEGSFEAAARLLHVTPSAVSQRIKALEETVGQVLVSRSKPCRATVAGRPLVRLAGQWALLEQEALAEAGTAPPDGTGPTRITVVVNADSLATWFLPALIGLRSAGVTFDIHQDDQEHTAELLRDGTAMAAVTAQREPVQGCRAQRLGAMRYRPLAAPELAARAFPNGLTTEALATAPMVVFNRKDQLQHRFIAQVTGRDLDPPVHYVPSTSGFNEAIRLGLGWGMVPEQLLHDEPDAGRYVDLADDRYVDVPLYWQHWRLDSALLGELTAAVRATAAATLR